MESLSLPLCPVVVGFLSAGWHHGTRAGSLFYRSDSFSMFLDILGLRSPYGTVWDGSFRLSILCVQSARSEFVTVNIVLTYYTTLSADPSGFMLRASFAVPCLFDERGGLCPACKLFPLRELSGCLILSTSVKCRTSTWGRCSSKLPGYKCFPYASGRF